VKILSAQQTRAADAATIANEPIASIDLMERAATAFYNRMLQFSWINAETPFVIVAGTGNNGGDGLVIARLLLQSNHVIQVCVCPIAPNKTVDFSQNEQRLLELGAAITTVESSADFPPVEPGTVVIDALFGSGLSRPIEGVGAQLIDHINQGQASVVSVDIPSGLFCDYGGVGPVISAHYTLTFEQPKLAFMFPENASIVGQWEVVPIGLDPEFLAKIDVVNHYVLADIARSIVQGRPKFAHKGSFGHALMQAGGHGKMGAAVLATRACLRSGVGLVTAHVPGCGHDILQTTAPEAMVIVDGNESYLTETVVPEKYHAVGIGPGLGQEEPTGHVLKMLIQNSGRPLVIDADALNLLAQNKTWLSFLPKRSILTPHPKEFERLVGESKDNYERYQMQLDFAHKHHCYIILKGAHTAIACPDGDVFFNSTGNPGMATGGSGDVLTGLLTGLLAQDYPSKQAAILGVYLHGLAGDIAAEKQSSEAMIAGDIIECFGTAFQALRSA